MTFPLSQEEKDFPLAYSMVVHHKVYAYFSLNTLTRCICSLKNQDWLVLFKEVQLGYKVYKIEMFRMFRTCAAIGLCV